MKVSNEYVQIKIGNKTFIKKNMLFDIYINRLFNSQINKTHDTTTINTCYIKFDTTIENVNYDTELSPSDFDISFTNEHKTPEYLLDKNYIKIKYKFNNFDGIEEQEKYNNSELANFYNKKITALAFGYESELHSEQNAIFSFIDTSNMNMILNIGENISIVRVDKFESEGICKGINFPLHLNNDMASGATWKSEGKIYNGGQLYSVGFGNSIGIMEEEYLIDNLETTIDDTSISFNLIRNKNIGIYPNNNLQLGFTPIKDNSKYLIFKYRLYAYGLYLDEYYTMSKPNDTFGNINIKIKIERL